MRILSVDNLVQLNNGSVTVDIENSRAQQWLKVLTSMYGTYTQNKDGSGQMWKIINYKESGRNVKITLYILPKGDSQSKILLQGIKI